MLITHLLPPLIIILLVLLSIPNIHLVYQVQVLSVFIDFKKKISRFQKQHSDEIVQISRKKPRVGLIDSSLALCLVASGGEGLSLMLHMKVGKGR